MWLPQLIDWLSLTMLDICLYFHFIDNSKHCPLLNSILYVLLKFLSHLISFVYPLITKSSPISCMIWSLNQIENVWTPNLCSLSNIDNTPWWKIGCVSEKVNKLSVIRKWMFITKCNRIAMRPKCNNWRIIILICCCAVTF